MRKILVLPRNGIAALRAALRQVSLAAFGASLTVACCSSDATAQTYANYVTPAAATNYQGAPVSGNAIPPVATATASDAAYSSVSDASRVEPASYGGGMYGGYGNLMSGGGGYAATNNCATPGCDVSWYVNYDALWLRRSNDEFFSLSQNTFMPDFEYEFGGRYTVGGLSDCVNGWEGVYTGPYDWQRQSAVLAAGSLQSRFVPGGTYTAAEIDTFNNANQHVQAWRSRLNSFELNRRWWTWDVLSTLIGVRYVDYEENYLFLSDSARGLGRFQNNATNRMVGAQIGADVLYPVSLRTNFGIRGKAGVYANFDEVRASLQNGAITVINAADSSVDVAGLIEMGFFTNYQIVPSVRLTAGYEFWYMPGIATVPGQGPQFVNPSSATRVNNDQELFLHGGSVGVQVLF